MKHSIYEFVETGERLPFDVSLHRVNYVPSHWHNSVEIIFALRGTLEVTVNNTRHTMSEGDVLLINSCHIHEVIGLDMNIIATYLVPTAYLKASHRGSEAVNFGLDSRTAGKEKKQALDRIRQLLAEMIQLTYKKSEYYELDMQIRMLAVFFLLLKQFQISARGEAVNEKYMERMLRIIGFLEENYRRPVTLQEIAEREYLSVPYLSKFFSDNFGLNFQSYLTSIRLKNAVEALLQHEQAAIADIAVEHGFPNAKSFYAAFKIKYHMTPNEYRKRYHPDAETKREAASANYLAFNQAKALGIVNQFLQRGRSASAETDDVAVVEREHAQVRLDGGEMRLLRHTWKNLITIGKAKEGLHADVQQQLRALQQTCPFRYLRFHGIFDDAMMVYQEEETGEAVYNFRFVEQLFDFLLSIGLKPFVELGFMPSALAADKSKTIFYRESYVSGPKSPGRWCELVERFLRHCLNRYGEAEVASWRFEFWNEPQLAMFWPGSMEDYCELYRHTYRTVKQCSAALQIGAPGTIITMDTKAFNETFFSFCREHQCMPDFIPLHYYPHETLQERENTGQSEPLPPGNPFRDLQEKFGRVSPNPDLLKEKLEKERSILRELGAGDIELYLTEWNSTAYHRELTNDTLYKAAYIVKNIVDNLDAIGGFGYWVLSDNIEETAASPKLFHGGLGLVAQHGIPKAGMAAYELLAKLGNRFIVKGKRYVVTAGRGGYQVLSFNYCHFDDLYALGDISFIDDTNRYNAFKDVKTIELEIDLTGLPEGRYRMVTYSLGRKHGSSYDRWVEMGAPDTIAAEDVAYLKAQALPRKQARTVEGGQELTYTATLEPHGVELMELIPLY
ncbi:AraC family transcriptional regulator [Gordoniibacillus kamchatkensis]|uniref:AraC family transcriptional regulator n=1 Tax=Gordoniibacillus kamchatkensis TaxID=1590651 RepID=A0ABR5AK80_9BACL|nr:helix-turn-helix domain-containing protein [Paenibacillus sp. VKM B-2647]KIL41441.1 AraC family transcriptional regulator [Paenibacillus sp. VKM B-2647]